MKTILSTAILMFSAISSANAIRISSVRCSDNVASLFVAEITVGKTVSASVSQSESGNWVALGTVEADSATMVFPLPMEGIEGITDHEAASYKVVPGDLSAILLNHNIYYATFSLILSCCQPEDFSVRSTPKKKACIPCF